MWPTGEGNGKPLQYSCLEDPMNSVKRQKDRTLKNGLPRLVGTQYATGDQWRNNSRKNEEMEPKQKHHPAVDVTGDASKVRCCKEKYCIGTWNVRSINQGKLEVVKQEMARVNVNLLGISELKWTRMGEFNSDDHFIYYYEQESLRRNGIAIIVNKRVRNAVHLSVYFIWEASNHYSVSDYVILRHATLEYWRFWIKDIWETGVARRTRRTSFSPLKTGDKSPLWKVPLGRGHCYCCFLV